MYLRASDKASGVENFQSAVGSKWLRRDLISKALHQGLTPRHGLEPDHFQYKKPQGGPLVVGILGSGQQGLRLLAAINPDFITVKSIADLRPSNQGLAVKTLLEVYKDNGKGWKTGEDVKKAVPVYDSYEKLIEAAKADGLEAVIVALPSHLHAEAALKALDAGLHVLVETPMALSVRDAKTVAAKAAEKKLVLAVGQQRRYSWIYDHALEMVRKDLLDQVHYVRSQWHVVKPEKKAEEADSDKKDDKKKAKKEVKKPGEFKIDWWQDVPKEETKLEFKGYGSPTELVRWQLYEKYSGGLLAELGSQLFEAAAMFIAASPNHNPQQSYPLSVAGSGGQVLRDAAGDIDDHVHCVFEYPILGYVDDPNIPPKARKKIALQVDMIIGNEFDGYGETVLGRQGSLIVESEQKAMLFHTSDVDKNLRIVEKKAGEKKLPTGLPAIEVAKDGKADEEAESLGRMALHGADAGFATELEHWAFCCKPTAEGKESHKPLCDAEAGLYTTVLTVAAARAVRRAIRVDFKKEWFDVKSDETPDDL